MGFRFLRVALTVTALAVALPLVGASLRRGSDPIPSKPYPERLVNDFAGALTSAQVDSLERVLVAFDDSTSNQIAVVTVPTLGGMDVSEFALRLANEWGIGTSEKNNGILILLKPRGNERYVDVSVQVGRGLEGAIPDVYASRIIRNIMGPYLREDNYIKALALGIDEFKALASGEISEPRDRVAEDDDRAAALWYMLLWVGLVVLIVWLLNKSLGGGNGGRW
ncbi:MAG: TPM domain-containing protein, partial [Bacteroidales bacterium]|nr:TPM domain-containing protein [Bacteroidales bacterium]